jgi:hypothetical protein
MRWLRGMAAATAALAAVMGAMVLTTSSAVAEPEGCAAQDSLGANDELRPGRALCNGNYLLRMQENGDLVLREISTGRACWHSNTFKAGVSTTFEPGWYQPLINKKPVLKVGEHEIVGDNDTTGPVTHDGTTANLNEKGELYIGYLKKASC